MALVTSPRRARASKTNRKSSLTRLGGAFGKTVLAAAVALCLTPSLAAAGWFGRPLDRGGEIGTRLQEIIASSGQRHEIQGDCMSSCTMWLGHKGTCVAPDAVLFFHAAADGLKRMHYVNPWLWKSDEGNRTLLSFYPPRVRAVVQRNGWLDTPEMHTLSGAQLIGLGVPACA